VTNIVGGCVAWPPARQPTVDLNPKGTPPILVIANSGDPLTPPTNARHLAAIFPKASVLMWDGSGHIWLQNAPNDACMSQKVTSYLLGGGVPPASTVCE
jgi:pimeloyl-ACP methyl ester carboxylesterase